MTNQLDFKSTDSRKCARCDGAGHRVWSDGTKSECRHCNGAGSVTAPNYQELLDKCLAKKGKNKGTLRASAPCNPYKSSLADRRAYYIWRLARFHGGADVTMPMTAELFSEGDPFKPELDAIAERMAKQVFGTDMAAAYRWASALGYSSPGSTPAGLPDSAYEGGRVADGNKPSFEIPELSEASNE